MNRLELGNKIAELRRQRNLSQTELAGRVGVSRAFLCDLERGASHDPGLQKIINILNYFSFELEIKPKTELPTLDDLLREQEADVD